MPSQRLIPDMHRMAPGSPLRAVRDDQTLIPLRTRTARQLSVPAPGIKIWRAAALLAIVANPSGIRDLRQQRSVPSVAEHGAYSPAGPGSLEALRLLAHYWLRPIAPTSAFSKAAHLAFRDLKLPENAREPLFEKGWRYLSKTCD
jgi:hypothetical protein